ncbi:MAG: WecB/TagA/CpsF family glycosyltransferase [Bacteroidota bacterium]|nr:WecB/TagA/CpsF family glycosyltransferase [Bacteroidota bacterium]
MLQSYTLFNQPLTAINQPRALINTLNAHSFNTVQKDEDFHQALQYSDILLPDGISVVWAMRMLTGKKLQKIAGADLFFYEMKRINALGGRCFFLGSSEETLQKIRKRAAKEYPNVQVYTYSPPFKAEFSEDENSRMINAVNAVKPDVLFVGMTAPKQEKWAYRHFDQLQSGHVCCIGAVFDFYAGTIDRAPNWLIQIGLEWSYRLFKEPRRMWRRYLIGNAKFIGYVMMEKIRN